MVLISPARLAEMQVDVANAQRDAALEELAVLRAENARMLAELDTPTRIRADLVLDELARIGDSQESDVALIAGRGVGGSRVWVVEHQGVTVGSAELPLVALAGAAMELGVDGAA